MASEPAGRSWEAWLKTWITSRRQKKALTTEICLLLNKEVSECQLSVQGARGCKEKAEARLSRALHVSRPLRLPLPTPGLSREEGTNPLQQRVRLLSQLKLLKVLQVTFFSKYPRLQTPEST